MFLHLFVQTLQIGTRLNDNAEEIKLILLDIRASQTLTIKKKNTPAQ